MIKKLSRKEIYKSQWVNLYVDKVQLDSGKILEEYHILDYPRNAVIILIKNQKKEICFIKSIRYPLQSLEWELPAGGIEKGENILDAAKREGFEETGFKTKKLEHVYSFHPNNGLSDQEFHVVFADLDEKEKQGTFDNDEVASVHWFSREKAKEYIEKNKIKDGATLIALMLYLNKLA